MHIARAASRAPRLKRLLALELSDRRALERERKYPSSDVARSHGVFAGFFSGWRPARGACRQVLCRGPRRASPRRSTHPSAGCCTHGGQLSDFSRRLRLAPISAAGSAFAARADSYAVDGARWTTLRWHQADADEHSVELEDRPLLELARRSARRRPRAAAAAAAVAAFSFFEAKLSPRLGVRAPETRAGSAGSARSSNEAARRQHIRPRGSTPCTLRRRVARMVAAARPVVGVSVPRSRRFEEDGRDDARRRIESASSSVERRAPFRASIASAAGSDDGGARDVSVMS